MSLVMKLARASPRQPKRRLTCEDCQNPLPTEDGSYRQTADLLRTPCGLKPDHGTGRTDTEPACPRTPAERQEHLVWPTPRCPCLHVSSSNRARPPCLGARARSSFCTAMAL